MKGEIFMNPLLNPMTATAVTSADWSSVITALTSQISVATVVEVLGVVAAACVGLAFMWWGVRKAVGSLMSAFKKGRVSI